MEAYVSPVRIHKNDFEKRPSCSGCIASEVACSYGEIRRRGPDRQPRAPRGKKRSIATASGHRTVGASIVVAPITVDSELSSRDPTCLPRSKDQCSAGESSVRPAYAKKQEISHPTIKHSSHVSLADTQPSNIPTPPWSPVSPLPNKTGPPLSTSAVALEFNHIGTIEHVDDIGSTLQTQKRTSPASGAQPRSKLNSIAGPHPHQNYHSHFYLQFCSTDQCTTNHATSVQKETD